MQPDGQMYFDAPGHRVQEEDVRRLERAEIEQKLLRLAAKDKESPYRRSALREIEESLKRG